MIPSRIYVECKNELAKMLYIISNISTNTDSLPDIWRKSIYKNGDRCDPLNYRPISLTCISC